MAAARIVGALLAAGRGSRFGGNKLEAMIGDRMIGECAARALADCDLEWTVAICNADAPALDAALGSLGFSRIENTTPEAGLSQSLRLAAQHAANCHADGLLVCLGDMPFVETCHLRQLVKAFESAGRGSVIASWADAHRTPPAIFPRSVFDTLMTLSGDRGAQALLKDAIPVSASAGSLADIDTRRDLETVLKPREPKPA